MRLGIRLQLLLALGSLLVLAFVPLFFAFASLTRATMGTVREGTARALGRSIAAHVSEASRTRSTTEMKPLLDAQIGREGVAAIGVFDSSGALVVHAEEDANDAALVNNVSPSSERVSTITTAAGRAIVVVVPNETASVAVLVRVDPSTTQIAPLTRLFALYTGAFALALLVFTYIVMTRLVVRPIDRLSRGAGRVASGARALELPRTGAAELADLGASLNHMTARLRADEAELRNKIAELERTTKDLASAQERLVRSERLASVGRLAAGLAHEIGNPIAAILGFQELMLDGGLDREEERDFLKRMKKETERVHKILRDLLDFARPAVQAAKRGDSMRPPPSSGEASEEGSVSDAARDVEALVKPQRGFKEIELKIDLAPDVPLVAISTSKLVQVLLNLLLNAAEVVPGVDGRVVVRAARADDHRVRLEVEDNGPGIPAAIRDRLFEPFVTTKEVGKGTGLGLAVCRGLIEAANGSINVERGDEGGARFVIDLPSR